MTIINGYQLIGELTSVKSGFAKWGFAKKDGKDVFIKEFLSPVYPIDTETMSPTQLHTKRQIFNEFAAKKERFYAALNRCATGNIVTACDMFRWKSKYYIITEKVDAKAIEPRDIAKMYPAQILLICKIVAHSVNSLHKNGIVHGDLKPDNILLKSTVKGFFTAKLIDFDGSFFANEPPDGEDDFQGDFVYLAPESFLYITGEIHEITEKIDVFALGVLFHQYFTGNSPLFDKSEYDYTFEAVLDDAAVTVASSIPTHIAALIRDMLHKLPDRRPTLGEVFARLEDATSPADNPFRPAGDSDL